MDTVGGRNDARPLILIATKYMEETLSSRERHAL